MRYSFQPRDRKFVKGYLSFAKIMCKNTSKNLSGKYSQKLPDHAKQSATDAFKTASEIAIQKTVEATVHLITNKSFNKITVVSKNSQQSKSETVSNEHYKEIHKERYISPKKDKKF